MSEQFGTEVREVVKHIVTGDMFDKIISLDFEDSGVQSYLHIQFVGDGSKGVDWFTAEAYGEFDSFMNYRTWWKVNVKDRYCSKGGLLELIEEVAA